MSSDSIGCLGVASAQRDMEVEAPPGTPIGSIHQDYIFTFQQWFSILNANGETVLKITKSTGNFFSPEVDFKVNRTPNQNSAHDHQ